MANPIIIPMPAAREPKQGEGLLSAEILAIVGANPITHGPPDPPPPAPSKAPLVIAAVGLAALAGLAVFLGREDQGMSRNPGRRGRGSADSLDKRVNWEEQNIHNTQAGQKRLLDEAKLLDKLTILLPEEKMKAWNSMLQSAYWMGLITKQTQKAWHNKNVV